MPIIVEVPDGELEFPDTFTEDQIKTAVNNHVFGGTPSTSGLDAIPPQQRETERPDLTGGGNFGVSAGERFFDNVSNIPRATGDLFAGAATAINTLPETISRFVQGEPQDFRERFGEEFSAEQERFPANLLRSVPLPDSLDVGAVRDTIVGAAEEDSIDNIASRFRVARRTREDERAARKQESPVSSMLGTGFGDALTLLTGRAPIAKVKAPQLTSQREAVEASFKNVPPKVTDELTDIVSEKVVPFIEETGRLLKRATGKSAGTGLEAAALAALNDSDPETAFWTGAGVQAAGSASLFISEKAVKHPLGFVATAWLASEMFKAASPGDQNFFESKDFSIQKAVGALSLGAISGLAGLGRIRGPTAEKAPVFMDAITAVPRGTLLSIIEQLRDSEASGNSGPLQVLSKISSDPSVFTTNEVNRINRAFTSEKKGEFVREVENMLKNTEFAEKLGE